MQFQRSKKITNRWDQSRINKNFVLLYNSKFNFFWWEKNRLYAVCWPCMQVTPRFTAVVVQWWIFESNWRSIGTNRDQILFCLKSYLLSMNCGFSWVSSVLTETDFFFCLKVQQNPREDQSATLEFGDLLTPQGTVQKKTVSISYHEPDFRHLSPLVFLKHFRFEKQSYSHLIEWLTRISFCQTHGGFWNAIERSAPSNEPINELSTCT